MIRLQRRAVPRYRIGRQLAATARGALCMLAFAMAAGIVADAGVAEEPAAPAPSAADNVAPLAGYKSRSLTGQVMWLAEALRSRYGIESDADAAESQVVLVTAAGELWPLVKEFRGRAFWTDPRLRGRDVELFVREFAGSSFVQVIRVYTLKDGKKFELDYWCDICAIPMYEMKACECCQGETCIRERLVEEAAPASSPSP